MPFPVQNSINLSSIQSFGQSLTLKEGQNVFGRVLSAGNSNEYTVAFASSKFNVRSNIPLAEGQTLNAKIHIEKDGTVVLTPLAERVFSESGANRSSGYEALLNMLSSEGFVPDELSSRIFMFMQQAGVRIDKSVMQKARSIALKFTGQEKEAAEAAALLLQDGLSADDETVAALLNLFLSRNSSGSGKNSGDTNSESKEQSEAESFLKKIYPSGTGNKTGLLTLLNQVKDSNQHWIFLPYEWDFQGKKFTGIIRILLNLSEKSTKKLIITCKNTGVNYDFVLYFNGSKVKEVRFCTLPPLLPSRIKSEELRLGGILNSGMNSCEPVTVTYSDSAHVDGICVTGELPSFVEERV